MGPYRTTRLIAALALLCCSAAAQEPGWHYSPLPGEGDRATLGCDRDAVAGNFICLAVRCEDDYTTGVHVHVSTGPVVGSWDMTLDRENATLVAGPSDSPYGARFVDDAAWLLERLRQGTFVYLRHADAPEAPFRFIDLSGSLYAINQALAWCAPRVPGAEPSRP